MKRREPAVQFVVPETLPPVTSDIIQPRDGVHMRHVLPSLLPFPILRSVYRRARVELTERTRIHKHPREAGYVVIEPRPPGLSGLGVDRITHEHRHPRAPISVHL